MEHVVAQILLRSSELGENLAKMKWCKCKDPNGDSGEYKLLSQRHINITKAINNLMLNIGILANDTESEELRGESEIHCNKAMERMEVIIERENRPTNTFYNDRNQKVQYGPMNYNRRAVINKTHCEIPEQALSLIHI